ncbi:MAG: RNB domain-containing ribonuclease, partial [Bdellovibrionales bacterium]|nr:RNB domain-containing ribonuclease [Bdellovibrionales bacterium]
ITIDDVTTRDMDDALSIEHTEGGYRLGIHITDVASCVEVDSPLDREAKSRATSLYFPEGTYHMFPESLSEEKLSLREGEPRRTLSILFEVDKLFEIQSQTIVPSWIEVKRRLSYEEVDHALELEHGDEFLLYQIAMSCEAHRLAHGGMNIPKRDVSIALSNRGQLSETDFTLSELDERGPARSLIGEMMILANHCFAHYAQSHSLPLLFRTQEDPDESKQPDLSVIPAGPAQDYAMRQGLKRSEITTSAARHSTLGLDAYAQVTSPIRRYGDLVNQRQLLSFLRENHASYTDEMLEHSITETSEANQRARLLTRETKRFWLLKYLKKKKGRKEKIQATVLRDDMKNYLVELEEIYIPAYLKTGTKLQRGDIVELDITAVDPRYDYLKLTFQKKY